MILFGVVVAVDYATKQLKLQDGGLTTGWIPFPAKSGRNWKAWHPVKLGQQFIAICRNGDAAQAKIVGELWWDENDSPSTDENIDLIEFGDGSCIEYNSSTHTMTISCVGELNLSANALICAGVAND